MKLTTKLMLGAATVMALGLSIPAMADEDSSNGLSGYITGVTDYRFRGISNSDRHPTIQASMNWEHEDGWYAGIWGSGVDFNDPGTTSIEIDLYGGKHFDLDGTDLNLEAYYYAYPDKNNALPTYSYFEGIVGVSHSWDAFTVGATAAWSPQYFGHTGTGWYVSGNASYAINDWLSISSNVGHQWVNDIGTNYTHWDAGATFTYDQFALDVRYIDTDVSFAGCGFTKWCGSTVVAAVTWNIGG